MQRSIYCVVCMYVSSFTEISGLCFFDDKSLQVSSTLASRQPCLINLHPLAMWIRPVPDLQCYMDPQNRTINIYLDIY